MNGQLPSERSESSLFSEDAPLKVLLVVIGLPVVVCIANYAILLTGLMGHRERPFAATRYHNIENLLLCYAIFISEVALVSWCIGRYLNSNVLRVIVFLWCMFFVNLMFVLVHYSANSRVSAAYGFASAQLGLLIAWAVLGRTPIGTRVFATLLGVVAVSLYMTALSLGDWRRSSWGTVLACQAIVTLLLCGALRWRRFQLRYVESPSGKRFAENETPNDDVRERVQFSIFHLLIWTSALAPIFAVARLVDWTDIAIFENIAEYAMYAVPFSLTSLVAIWAGLGGSVTSSKERGRFRVFAGVLVRSMVTLLFTVLAGSLIAYATKQQWVNGYLLRMYFWNKYEEYMFWIPWCVLAGFFYMAILLVFRSTGQRLVRVRRSKLRSK